MAECGMEPDGVVEAGDAEGGIDHRFGAAGGPLERQRAHANADQFAQHDAEQRIIAVADRRALHVSADHVHQQRVASARLTPPAAQIRLHAQTDPSRFSAANGTR